MKYTREDGVSHLLELKPPKHPNLCRSMTSAQMPILSRDDLVSFLKSKGGSFSLKDYCPSKVYNQSSEPYCWDVSTVQMLASHLNMATGEEVPLDFSTAPVLCNSVGSGDAIDACLKEVLIPYGCPTAKFMGTDPVIGSSSMKFSKSHWVSGWKANAAKRMAKEYVTAGHFIELASGIVNSHFGVFGVSWQGGGHAIGAAEVGLTQSGGLYLATPGTWGMSFSSGWGSYPGRPGWYKLSENQCSAAWSGPCFGAYLLCGVVDSDESSVSPEA